MQNFIFIPKFSTGNNWCVKLHVKFCFIIKIFYEYRSAFKYKMYHFNVWSLKLFMEIVIKKFKMFKCFSFTPIKNVLDIKYKNICKPV